MEKTLETLLLTTKSAMHDDPASVATLKLIGEVLMLVGGVEAMCELQGKMHDYAVDRHRLGSRGDAIGNFWEHIPAWASL